MLCCECEARERWPDEERERTRQLEKRDAARQLELEKEAWFRELHERGEYDDGSYYSLGLWDDADDEIDDVCASYADFDRFWNADRNQ